MSDFFRRKLHSAIDDWLSGPLEKNKQTMASKFLSQIRKTCFNLKA